MKLVVNRETLLKPLQQVQGVVERRQTQPMLANVLINVESGRLSMTATDMEVELRAHVEVEDAIAGDTTVPARKLLDICRSLPPESVVELETHGEQVRVQSGKSRFNLSTLPAGEYPAWESLEEEVRFTTGQGQLRSLIELTHFAMAHQDVRYYLNGLLLDINNNLLRAVATDGHRLAVAERSGPVATETPRQIIVPRKAVMELLRLLGDEDSVDVIIGNKAIQMSLGNVRFTSKLIDGLFPDYEAVVPNVEECDKQIDLDRESFRVCLARAAILSNDKYRAIRLSLGDQVLRIEANNPEHEEAHEEMEVAYGGEEMEIGFNVSYLIDALSVLPATTARLHLQDATKSCLITPTDEEACRYVVMPMRL